MKKHIPISGESLLKVARLTARAGAPKSLVRRAQFPFRAPTVPASVEPKKKPPKIGSDYDTAWARRYPSRLARVLLVEGVVRPTIEMIATPTVNGLDRIADLSGPAVFAANHHSHVDTPLLLSQMPEPWRHHIVIGAAADYFFGNRYTGALSALVIGAIPIERTKISRKSADDAAALIDEGWSFLIFPEGGRSPDGWGQPFRGGAAYLALRCGVPVVPIHVQGTGRILRKGKTRPNRSPTRITFGAPMWPGEGEDSRKFARRIEAEVAALADESGTDWYSARVRAHMGETPSLVGPGTPGAWRRAWALGDRSAKRRRQKRAWPEL